MIISKREEGNTLLHEATKIGNNKLVTLLLENGADVNATDQKGNTPLQWLYHSTSITEVPKCHNYYVIAILLLNYDANFNAENNEFKKPLDLAKSDSLKAILMNTNLLFDAIEGEAAVNAE